MLSELNYRKRRVKTTDQARSLQSLSCDPCLVCGKPARGFANATYERFGPAHDGSIVSFGPPMNKGNAALCAKHKGFTGEVTEQPNNYGQFNKYVIS